MKPYESSLSLSQLRQQEAKSLIDKKIITEDQQFWLKDEVSSGLAIATYTILLFLTIVVGRLIHRKNVSERIKDILTGVLCIIWILLLVVQAFRLHIAIRTPT